MSRTLWNSRIGFILACAGSAIGLGAIWKFPYVVAKNGGGIFLLLFTIFSFVIGLTLLMAEISLGRAAQSSNVGAYRKLGGKYWQIAGIVGVLAGFLILAFYSVVGGWTLAYLVQSFFTDTETLTTESSKQIFLDFSQNPYKPIIYHAIFMFMNAFIVILGVQKGIERLSKWLMSALFAILILLIIRTLTLPNAIEGIKFFLMPDFSKVTANTLIDALGLSFFTLSVGIGIMITYGSYLPKGFSIPFAASTVAFINLMVCTLAGLIVLPAVFSFGFDLAAGPGLTFITMPVIFTKIPYGHFVGIAFFFLLVIAALTSSVSLMEGASSFLIDEFNMSRTKATIIMAAVIFLLGIPASLSLGIWKDYTLFGKGFFELLDYTTEKILMPLGAILISFFVGWKKWDIFESQLTQHGSKLKAAFLIKWFCRILFPVCIIGVFIKNL